MTRIVSCRRFQLSLVLFSILCRLHYALSSTSSNNSRRRNNEHQNNAGDHHYHGRSHFVERSGLGMNSLLSFRRRNSPASQQQQLSRPPSSRLSMTSSSSSSSSAGDNSTTSLSEVVKDTEGGTLSLEHQQSSSLAPPPPPPPPRQELEQEREGMDEMEVMEDNNVDVDVVDDYVDDDDVDDDSMEEDEAAAAAFFQIPIPVAEVPNDDAVTVGTATTVKQVPSLSAAIVAARIKSTFICGLLAVTGFEQAVCYHTFGSYPNMMTGHAIKLMERLSSGMFGSCIFHTTMIMSYMAGLSMFAHLKHRHHNKWGQTTTAATATTTKDGMPSVIPSQMSLSRPKNLLTSVSRVATTVFILSDVMAWLVAASMGSPIAATTIGGGGPIGGMSALVRLPIMAVAFGLINASTVDAIGVVTFAITGQINKIGVTGTEMFWLQRNQRQGGGKRNNNNNAIFDLSCQGLVTFLGSLLVTNILLKAMGGSYGGTIWTSSLPSSSSSSLLWLQRFLSKTPPFGIVLAGMYSALFSWYTSAMARNNHQRQREEEELILQHLQP